MSAAYTSHVRLQRLSSTSRRAWLPAEPHPVHFSIHSGVADHYKVPPEAAEPHASTLDYLVASAAGCLCGTFGGALEARGIPAGEGLLECEAAGDYEKENGTLVLKRIHLTLRIKAGATHRETIARVFTFFADRCPIYKTLKPVVHFHLHWELIQL